MPVSGQRPVCRQSVPNGRQDVLCKYRSDVYGLVSWSMVTTDPVLIDLPMPIRTPRLTIRPKQIGDGAIAFSAVMETSQELNQWMRWAQNRDAFTAESMEIRNRHVMVSSLLRESIDLIGIETQTGESLVWCGLQSID